MAAAQQTENENRTTDRTEDRDDLMGCYFKPLRRKLGVATLVISCMFAVGWLRSLMIGDVVDYWSSFTVQDWSSSKGIFRWSGAEHGRVIPRAQRGRFNWKTFELTRMTDSKFADIRTKGWPWKILGVSYYSQQEPIKAFNFRIRYSSVVAPLTLLSAWLLLSKPRSRKTQSPVRSPE